MTMLYNSLRSAYIQDSMHFVQLVDITERSQIDVETRTISLPLFGG